MRQVVVDGRWALMLAASSYCEDACHCRECTERAWARVSPVCRASTGAPVARTRRIRRGQVSPECRLETSGGFLHNGLAYYGSTIFIHLCLTQPAQGPGPCEPCRTFAQRGEASCCAGFRLPNAVLIWHLRAILWNARITNVPARSVSSVKLIRGLPTKGNS